MAAVGDAKDHLGDPETNDKSRVARDSAVVAERINTIVELGWPVAERGQFAPRAEAEHGGRDDGGHVEAGAEASANTAKETRVHEPSAEEHQDRVAGEEHHSDASEGIDLAESVTPIPAFIICIVCTALINDLLIVLISTSEVGIVFGPHRFFLIVVIGQLVIEVTRTIVHTSD